MKRPTKPTTKLNQKISSLPNYGPSGSYCFLSQCILLDSVNLEDLKNIFTSDFDYHMQMKYFPLLNHESRHWYDAHSTLWGINLIYEAYKLRQDVVDAERNGIQTDISHFNKQIDFFDKVNGIKYPEYYYTVNKSSENTAPWSYEYTHGLLLSKSGTPSDRPIFFTRFKNNKNEHLARVPFSICALLEASAVCQEINSKLIILNTIEDNENDHIVAAKLLEQEIYRELYSVDAVEYSVVAHKVANTFSISDIREAYNISSLISRFLLNIPKDFFSRINVEKIVPSSPNIMSLIDAYKKAVIYHDIAGLFPLFVDGLRVYCVKHSKSLTQKSFSEILDGLLKESSGFSLSEMEVAAKTEIEQLHRKAKREIRYPYAHETIKEGSHLFESLGVVGTFFINLDAFGNPDHLLGDDEFISNRGTNPDEFQERWLEMQSYYEFLAKYNAACII